MGQPAEDLKNNWRETEAPCGHPICTTMAHIKFRILDIVEHDEIPELTQLLDRGVDIAAEKYGPPGDREAARFAMLGSVCRELVDAMSAAGIPVMVAESARPEKSDAYPLLDAISEALRSGRVTGLTVLPQVPEDVPPGVPVEESNPGQYL